MAVSGEELGSDDEGPSRDFLCDGNVLHFDEGVIHVYAFDKTNCKLYMTLKICTFYSMYIVSQLKILKR